MSENVAPSAKTIDSCALLVEASISVWTARKLDRTVTDEVIQNKAAQSRGAARVNKNLLADRPELERIQKHANAVRTYLYTHTLPWSNSGPRLLPTAEFFAFNQRMMDFQDEFERLVEEFVSVYPTLITAQAMALGAMFDRNEYPSPDGIRRKFSFAFSYMPVPAAGDFRVDVGLEAQQELREQLEKESERRIAAAAQEVKDRLTEHLTRMSDRLTSDIDEKTNELKPRRFHASLIEGAYELCGLVRNLNITMDTKLEKARLGLQEALREASAEDLRDNDTLRESVKTDVDRVLKELNE